MVRLTRSNFSDWAGRQRPSGRIVLVVLLALLPLSALAGSPSLLPPRESDFSDELMALHAVLDFHQNVGRLSGLDYGLPADDFDDSTNLTLRQRRSFRSLYPETPAHGVYQYPRWAFEFMHKANAAGEVIWGGEVVDARDLPPLLFPTGVLVATSVVVANNVNETGNTQVESETYVAIDPTDQRYLVGGSNSMSVNPQVMYRSSDWGATWVSKLLVPNCTVNSDPWTGFDSQGYAYTSTLDYTSGACKGKGTQVTVSRSTDHGATWSAGFAVSTNSGNDKQLNAIDYQPSSPCRDHHYMGWDSGNSEYVGSAPAWNGPWTIKSGLDTGAIGTDIAVGPAGEIYNVWANSTLGQINFAKSTDCGATWSVRATIATTADTYDYAIPAQCNRKALIYPSVDLDRSNGPRRGWVYVAWNDFSASYNGACIAVSNTANANVWFSRSTDGGATWLPKKMVHQDIAKTDQFSQWMRVDDADGTIHASWYDTRDDLVTRAKTNIYYTRSADGGTNFDTETRVTTEMTDESSGANSGQYGDYAGLAVRNGVAYPFWTDRRASSGTDEEVFAAKICSEPKGGTTAALDVSPCAVDGLTITWSAPSVFWGDGGSAAASRKYQLFQDGLLVQDNVPAASTSLNWSPGDSSFHIYTIKAVNGCATVGAYASSAAIADIASSAPPSPVANSLFASRGSTTVQFAWGASPTPGVSLYRLYGANSLADAFPTGWSLVTSTATLAVTDALSSGWLYYLVSAVDGCGNESSPE